jgi:hypothetical protein
MKSFILALALLVSVVFTGCGGPEAPALQTGKDCTVQFRRDALGAAANNPVPPMVNRMNGAETCAMGTLKRASAEWVVIEKHGKEIWIPRSVILLIEQ